MNEEWRDIIGYEGLYQVSNLGRIMNSKGLILKQRAQNSGYNIVHLYACSKRRAFTVHRIVARTFIEIVPGKEYVNHKDGNKLNNQADNLEWCTAKENEQHAVSNGLFHTYARSQEHLAEISERMSRVHGGIKKPKSQVMKLKCTNAGKAPQCVVTRKRSDFVTVLREDTGEIFPTIKDAADSIGCPKDKLWRHLRCGTQYNFIKCKFKIIKDGSKSLGRKK